MKKLIILSFILLTSLVSNAQMKQGSVFSYYQLERGMTFWNDDQEPNAVVVDKQMGFSPKRSMEGNSATKSISYNYAGYNWSGFIEIKEAGAYVFSLNTPTSGDVTTYLYINSKKYLDVTGSTASSVILRLDIGFYKIDLARICYGSTAGQPTSFSYWNKNSPTKRIEITPANLLYLAK